MSKDRGVELKMLLMLVVGSLVVAACAARRWWGESDIYLLRMRVLEAGRMSAALAVCVWSGNGDNTPTDPVDSEHLWQLHDDAAGCFFCTAAGRRVPRLWRCDSLKWQWDQRGLTLSGGHRDISPPSPASAGDLLLLVEGVSRSSLGRWRVC